jgi:hypothetical protein
MIKLDDRARSRHLPHLFKELVHRLRNPLPLGTQGEYSKSVHDPGVTQRKLGYSADMLVEESRMLQVSIFDTLWKNDNRMDIRDLLPDVMVIADEVDLQLVRLHMTDWAMEIQGQIVHSNVLPLAMLQRCPILDNPISALPSMLLPFPVNRSTRQTFKASGR